MILPWVKKQRYDLVQLIVRMDYLFMMSERQKPLVQRNNLNDKMNATIHLKIKSGRKIR